MSAIKNHFHEEITNEDYDSIDEIIESINVEEIDEMLDAEFDRLIEMEKDAENPSWMTNILG